MESIHQNDTINRTIQVTPWRSEKMLKILIILISLAIWVLLAISIIGIIYVLFIALFLFVSHLVFIAYIRGNGVKLGPDQMPELYARVQELAVKAGMKKIPDAYIIQAGGTLNALATRFLGAEFIILFSDLLDACGENKAARDMIVGHEIGHLKEGHLRFLWFLFPGLVFPFLGSAYSRAKEYTCDRYGMALCRNRDGALLGLAILAAGGKEGPRVNINALIEQRVDMNTGMMTIGKWLSSHPPLCDRMSVLAPDSGEPLPNPHQGPVRAFAIISFFVIIPIIALSIWAVVFFNKVRSTAHTMNQQSEYEYSDNETRYQEIALEDDADIETNTKKVQNDLRVLAKLADEVKGKTGSYPPDDNYSLHEAWKLFRSGQEEPVDPFDGQFYGYMIDTNSGGYVIWSVGPDKENGNDDDIYITSQP